MKNKVISILLALALILTSAVNIFALEENIEDVNASEVLDSDVLDPEKPEEPEEPIEDDEPQIEVPEEEEVVAEEADEHAQSIEEDDQISDSDEIEISDEEIPVAVGVPEGFDLSTINTIAKDKDGNFYGVRTYGNSLDTKSGKTFYNLTEEEYNQIADDCFMVFKRQDGGAFEIPGAKIGTNSISDTQPSGTVAGPIFTELQFRHHMAYREGFISSNDPTRIDSQKDLNWYMELKKDWIIEPYAGFGDNNTPDDAYTHFNLDLEGNGFTLKRNDTNDPGIFQIGPAHSGGPGSNKTVTIKNLNIVGDDNYFGILLRDTTTLNLENTHISNCNTSLSSCGGGITLLDDTVLNMDANSSINGCKAKFGGAIKLSNNATVNINGSNISNNQAEYGGAIYSSKETSEINIKNAKLADNASSNQGGAIYANSRLNIDGTEFTNNSTSYYGGAIMNFMDTKIKGSNFGKNKANTDGGAIYQSGTSKLDIEKTYFLENECNKNGGAVYINKGVEAKIEEAEFEKNASNNSGGGIFIQGNNPNEVEVIKCNFEENKAAWGGAIFDKGNSSIKNANFNKNYAQYYGGAIYTANGTTIEGSHFIENKTLQGGGIYINNNAQNSTIVSDTSFEKNSVDYGGAGIFVDKNSKLEVTNSTFTKNSAVRGAGISSAADVNIDTDLSNIKVEGTSFTGNEVLEGGGIFTAFPTEITNSTFTKNQALAYPQDDQTNPHDSGVGGAIRVMDNKTTIKASTFEDNFAGGSGGAIGINGLIRDNKGKITGIKENIKVVISDSTKFRGNICNVGQGGAIYTIPYLYDIEDQESDVVEDTLKANAYNNLSTAADTVFKDNVALSGFVDPPKNYKDYTDLKFDRNSFKETLPNEDVAKSLLNNYDVNYKNEKLSAFFDPNGGEFTEGENPKDTRVVKGEINKEITLLDAPKKEGYKFTGWKCSMNIPEEILKALPKDVLEKINEGKIFKAGDKFVLDADYIFIAQWAAEEPEPEPKPEPYDPGYFYDPSPDYLNEKSEPERRDLDVYRWYMEGNENNEFMPKKGITRAEMTQIFARALAYDGYKTYGDYNPYPDVDPNKWYYQAVITTTEAGVFKGTDMGTFEPEREITQAELIATISRFQKLNNKDGNAFEMKFDHWARPEVQAAYEEKWLELYKDGRANFNADAVITREEVATILNKAFGRPIDEKYIEYMQANIKDIEKALKTFKDIDKDMWSYYEILTAANTYAVNYKDKERTDYGWYNHAIEDDGPSMPVEKVRWYNGLLNNDKYIDHLYQIKFQREMRRY
ncbi:S-layer homology domain-containing protein [Ezakiella peruensis]|uniref:S-layer homology domain-containing protein n=1 Tax=Ezakiella peruensis TaxID=1464038 RepID=UPI000C1B2D8C|nr:S-layer homology domain-containing protein [Ezakiella peruensis]